MYIKLFYFFNCYILKYCLAIKCFKKQQKWHDMFSLVVFNCHVEMELLTCNIVCYLTNDNYLYQLTIILSIYITLIDKILQL